MKIVLALDHSIYSESAADTVIARTWPPNCSFKIISVLEESNPSSEQTGKTEELLKSVVQRLQQKLPGADVSSEILRGNCKQKILDFANEWSADLVALGSHGRTGLTRILLGSVSQTVLLYSESSVLVVRLPESKDQTGLKRDPQKVLIPLDASEHSRTALDWVLSLGWSDSCHFKILSVLAPLADTYSDGLDMLQGEKMSTERVKARKTAEEMLQTKTAKLVAKFGAGRVSTDLREGNAGDTILKMASAWPADLIVMGTRGHGQLKRLWLGSISQEIVLQARCPVEVVKKRLTDG